MLALATHLGYVCVSFISHMAQQSARLQASCSQEIYKELRERAEKGRRSISREVEYILELGLAAARAQGE